MCQKLGAEQSELKEERKWWGMKSSGEEPGDVREDATVIESCKGDTRGWNNHSREEKEQSGSRTAMVQGSRERKED